MAVSLLFPMVTSLVHAAEEHHSQVCTAQGESHIHKQPNECSHEHYFSGAGTSLADDPFDHQDVDPGDLRPLGRVCDKRSKLNRTLELRGPPVINV
jgi:hypothetical protein